MFTEQHKNNLLHSDNSRVGSENIRREIKSKNPDVFGAKKRHTKCYLT